MPAWKVFVILLFAVSCLGMATATVIVPLNYKDNERWLWTGGLLAGTVAVGVLFVLFLRHADANMDGPRK